MAKREIRDCRTILTGASSGIGRALTEQLGREGAKVVAVARRGQELETLARSLSGQPGQIEAVAGDITQAAGRAAAIGRAQQKFGGLDLLINNAGISAIGPFPGDSPDRLRRVMEVNFFAAVEMIRLALPLLRVGVRPMIVNMSSVLGHRGIPNCAEYCASKFAIQGFSESLRAELAPLAIDVLVVSPGTVDTGFFEAAIDAGQKPWRPMKGMAPETVARRVVHAIRKGKHEILPGSGKLLYWLNRIAPGGVDWFLARYGVS